MCKNRLVRKIKLTFFKKVPFLNRRLLRNGSFFLAKFYFIWWTSKELYFNCYLGHTSNTHGLRPSPRIGNNGHYYSLVCPLQECLISREDGKGKVGPEILSKLQQSLIEIRCSWLACMLDVPFSVNIKRNTFGNGTDARFKDWFTKFLTTIFSGLDQRSLNLLLKIHYSIFYHDLNYQRITSYIKQSKNAKKKKKKMQKKKNAKKKMPGISAFRPKIASGFCQRTAWKLLLDSAK